MVRLLVVMGRARRRRCRAHDAGGEARLGGGDSGEGGSQSSSWAIGSLGLHEYNW